MSVDHEQTQEDHVDDTCLLNLDRIRVGTSPRIGGVDAGHMRIIAETEADLPPVVVHRPTMRLIDGAHRLGAARMRGDTHIRARFFDGTELEAFLMAVRENVAHGLPLTLPDRIAAVERILAEHPELSDRAIAKTAGLAHKTVAGIRRRCPTGAGHRSDTRIGVDGRARPVDAVNGRRRVESFLREHPQSSLREVAGVVGVSPETVRRVRHRLRDQDVDRTLPHVAGDPAPEHDPAKILALLQRDPALRFAASGRLLLRLLDAHAMSPDSWRELADQLPAHCLSHIAALCKHNAELWRRFGESVEHRADGSTR